ncbi:hypothetical protein [Streptomyces sp. CC77]|uniref:hypothetical protein n=1 Tax=Streptomyces sp. CC77 TaxID=1906739 RepID=UPI0008DD6249|nr:hypothetical protein [Streptomyces sp. CC77]OII68264.1 hypothetical protein BJP39_00420 [Streptomyces sp. CC77]
MPINLVDLPARCLTVPRDRWGRPLVVPKGGGKPRGLTRTTTFVDAIEDKSALTAWGKRMTLLGAAREPSLLDQLKYLNPQSPEDKPILDQLAERAVTAAGANVKRERGTHLHSLSERVDQRRELPPGTSASDVADMAAYEAATARFEVVEMERFVVVDELGVGGTFDRLLRYAGPGPDGRPFEGLLIGDLKTGSVQYGGLKMASQLAVYSRGELYDHTAFPVNAGDAKELAAWKRREVPADLAATAYSAIPGVNRKWGVIIHLPAGEARCTLYWADLRVGWEAARLCLDIRRARATKGALVPFGRND